MFYLRRTIVKCCSFILLLIFSQNVIALQKNNTTLDAGAIASPDYYGALAAQQILQKGGNAVDAAVATAFALAVTYPEAGNIGGGGFMTLLMDGKPYFIDYREVAPALASRDMYLDTNKEVIDNLSLYSYKAPGVPGTVAGMWSVHQRFGRLPWQQVLQPAIEFANDGFYVESQLAQRYQEVLGKAPNNSYFEKYFSGLQTGKLFKQPELANVLTLIAKQGMDGFYKGETAKLIASQMAENGGLITEADLANYQAKWRKPLIANWQGMQIITAPPPSSGGVGLIQLLTMKNILADEFKNIEVNSPKYIHLLAEIEKRVFADRAQYMGDPDFISVPVTKLIDHAYLLERANQVNPNAISNTDEIQPGLSDNKEKLQTTHFSVVDKWGNAVSNTYTLNGWFGSTIVIKGTGIILNNEMDDFSSKPGIANQFGVVGNDANAIEANKRPLSSMTPTIITKDNQVLLVIGTPGGSRIFTSIFQVIANVFDNQMSLSEAVFAPRYHHQLLPKDQIFIERFQNRVSKQFKQTLEDMGYNFYQQDFSGDIQAIQILDNQPNAVSDIRGRGRSMLAN